MPQEVIQEKIVVKNWRELSLCESEQYRLLIDVEVGFGYVLKDNQYKYYLPTHIFDETDVEYFSRRLNEYGFNVKLISEEEQNGY